MLSILILLGRATGTAFIVSGTSKLLARESWEQTLGALPFLPARAGAITFQLLPWVELALGTMLLAGLFTRYAGSLAVVLLLAFSCVAAIAARGGLRVLCSCFGELSQRPLSWGTVERNALLTLLLLPLVIGSQPSPFSIDAAIGELGGSAVTDVVLPILLPVVVFLVVITILSARRVLSRLSVRELDVTHGSAPIAGGGWNE